MNIKAKIFVIENILTLSIWLVILVLSLINENRIVLLTAAGVFGLILSTSIIFLIEGEKVPRLIGIYAALIFLSLFILNSLFIHNDLLGLILNTIFVIILGISTTINLKNRLT